jgi:hypothetical protein
MHHQLVCGVGEWGGNEMWGGIFTFRLRYYRISLER